jgi:hypothetical protein
MLTVSTRSELGPAVVNMLIYLFALWNSRNVFTGWMIDSFLKRSVPYESDMAFHQIQLMSLKVDYKITR